MRERRQTMQARWGVCMAALCAAGMCLAGLEAAAQPPARRFMPTQDEPPRALVAQQRGGGVSLQQATAIAMRQHQGRVVRAETVARNGRLIHEVRILGDDGRVRTVRIDAETGRMQ